MRPCFDKYYDWTYIYTETAICVEGIILLRGGTGDVYTYNGSVQLLHTIIPPLLKQVRHYIIFCVTNYTE